MQGKVSIDEAEYMASANTPDPDYVYDDDIKVAFKNKIKSMVDYNGMYNLFFSVV